MTNKEKLLVFLSMFELSVQKQEELSNTGNVIISVGKYNITVENKTPVTLLKDVLSVVGELC